MDTRYVLLKMQASASSQHSIRILKSNWINTYKRTENEPSKSDCYNMVHNFIISTYGFGMSMLYIYFQFEFVIDKFTNNIVRKYRIENQLFLKYI